MNLDLQGKVALITGGNRGIGRGIALELAQAGCTIVLSARDETALGLLYDRYGGLAFALAYRQLGDRGHAEDIVQEAFLSVWRRSSTFDTSKGSVRGSLMSVVRNAAIDRRRGRFKHQAGEVGLFAGENDLGDG